MNEPLDILTRAALARLTDVAHEMRSNGWDVVLRVEQKDNGWREANLVVQMPGNVPIETASLSDRRHP